MKLLDPEHQSDTDEDDSDSDNNDDCVEDYDVEADDNDDSDAKNFQYKFCGKFFVLKILVKPDSSPVVSLTRTLQDAKQTTGHESAGRRCRAITSQLIVLPV